MKSSVFVRIDRYREISGTLSEIRSKLDDAIQALRKIRDLKSQEEAELKNWQTELDTTDQKLSEVSRAMSER